MLARDERIVVRMAKTKDTADAELHAATSVGTNLSGTFNTVAGKL